MPHRLKKQSAQDVDSILQRLGLRGNEFLLYPANFWAHKNHRMLLTAFVMYRARHPESNLRLVCTGALENEKKVLQEAVYRMGQKDWIILPGFLTEEEFAAIFASCLALVFPSLYEGFGMPVLEAMALEKPVICSNVTSLPEVAGDAAFYVDPRKPREIVNAIERIATDKDLRKRLIDQGRHRLAESGGPEKMAREYLDVFLDVMRKPGPGAHILHGDLSGRLGRREDYPFLRKIIRSEMSGGCLSLPPVGASWGLVHSDFGSKRPLGDSCDQKRRDSGN